MTIESGSTLEQLEKQIQNEFQIDQDLTLSTQTSILSEDSQLMENQNIFALVDVLGGKGGKKKKKQYTTAKKNKHKHKNKKLHVLSYYALQKDGSLQRVKKFCDSSSCSGKGIFMANHKNRYYCGKCHVTVVQEAKPQDTKAKGGKKK